VQLASIVFAVCLPCRSSRDHRKTRSDQNNIRHGGLLMRISKASTHVQDTSNRVLSDGPKQLTARNPVVQKSDAKKAKLLPSGQLPKALLLAQRESEAQREQNATALIQRVGVFVKNMRLERQLTIDALARTAGISKATLHDLEQGASAQGATLNTIASLAWAFELTPEALLRAQVAR
jgi:DNA-binding XRE family transcriptional regulator